MESAGPARARGNDPTGGGADNGAGGGGAGGGGAGGESGDGNAGAAGEKQGPKIEIPQDIAEASGSEDQVARQIREAAEQEENRRIREALWDEYRKHMGLKSK